MRTIILLMATFLAGCVESSFELSPESKLPKWFQIPEELVRNDVTVRLTYYLIPTEKSVLTLVTTDGKVLNEITAHRSGEYLYPKELKSPPKGFPQVYPSYEVLLYSDITDVIEHRKMEPIFYVSDDEEIWKKVVQ